MIAKNQFLNETRTSLTIAANNKRKLNSNSEFALNEYDNEPKTQDMINKETETIPN